VSGAERGTKGPPGEAPLSPGIAPVPTAVVRAGGGVVWRRVPSGVEVVLVHRPAYDDWAFPKGKLERGETDEEAALREVREETGLSCRLGRELASTTYLDGQGRPKTVRYWAMTVVPGSVGRADGKLAPEPKARREIDDLSWVPLHDVRQRLTYPRDVVVLDDFSGRLASSNVSNAGRQEVNEVPEGKPQRDKANQSSKS
jgi:8-oxo-dGTP pyrophosphatase MutT (NUDIX family)